MAIAHEYKKTSRVSQKSQWGAPIFWLKIISFKTFFDPRYRPPTPVLVDSEVRGTTLQKLIVDSHVLCQNTTRKSNYLVDSWNDFGDSEMFLKKKHGYLSDSQVFFWLIYVGKKKSLDFRD